MTEHDIRWADRYMYVCVSVREMCCAAGRTEMVNVCVCGVGDRLLWYLEGVADNEAVMRWYCGHSVWYVCVVCMGVCMGVVCDV